MTSPHQLALIIQHTIIYIHTTRNYQPNVFVLGATGSVEHMVMDQQAYKLKAKLGTSNYGF